MFFYLSKILSFLITPIVWIVGVLIFTVFTSNPSRKRKLLIITLILTLLVSNSFLLDEAMREWEIPAISQDELGKDYDAGIVLGGMVGYDFKLERMQFNRGVDRLLQAIELYKRGFIKKIIFVGGSGSIAVPEAKEGLFIRDFLLNINIPEQDFIIESESRNTYENALFTSKILQTEFSKESKFLLITSAFHMRRSIACFEKQGIETKPYSTDRYSGPRRYHLDYLLIPNSDALMGWNMLLHELNGYVVYKMAGYI